SGFAHLAMQDAAAAADELERCMRELKFCGAMINGHTNGKYLDDRSLDPFWERAQALEALIYLHPADPITPAPVLDGYKGLRRGKVLWSPPHPPCVSFWVVSSCVPRARGSHSFIAANRCLSCCGFSTAAPARTLTRSSSPSVPPNT